MFYSDKWQTRVVHSKEANTLADRALVNVLKSVKTGYSDYSFLCRGSDERQYNAPGIELPVVAFCRSKYGMYPEYHTSEDSMEVVSPSGFAGAYDAMTKVIRIIEHNQCYKTRILCEPQLGKRGLYPTISQKGSYDAIKIMTDFIAYCDGKRDLIDLSEKIEASVMDIIPIIDKLLQNDIIKYDC